MIQTILNKDLIIEGLSFARTQKEFNSIIVNNNGDVNALFSNLKEFVQINFWWARRDSNLGPIHYECTALTN